jgi:hypothetical protein
MATRNRLLPHITHVWLSHSCAQCSGLSEKPKTDSTAAHEPVIPASEPSSATPPPHILKLAKQPKVNVRRSSRLIWFNKLLREPQLKNVRKNLVGKIGNTREHKGCLEIVHFKDIIRPTLDKRYYDTFYTLAPNTRVRFMLYQLAFVKANILMPDYDLPKYPQAFRHISQKRNADQEVNKPATWVILHLCHNKLCVNPIHLTWEPSWFNRLRDICPTGDDPPWGDLTGGSLPGAIASSWFLPKFPLRLQCWIQFYKVKRMIRGLGVIKQP